MNGCTLLPFRGHFRCDIKGLRAESATQDEHFGGASPALLVTRDKTFQGEILALPIAETEFMSRIVHRPLLQRRMIPGLLGALMVAPWVQAQTSPYPITSGQKATAQKVAEAGVPLSELAPDAPESHTVQRGDTLWDISKLFLKSPWRWPELWGMNLDQIRNPHLIYPGQVLVLVKEGGRAQLRLAQGLGQSGGTVKLSPRMRAELLDNGAIASVPLNLIGPFLNEAVVFNSDELATAPRIVATQEGRVLVSRGEIAYVRGDLKGNRDFRVFRESRPLKDPITQEILGHEAVYVGAGELTRAGEMRPVADGKASQVVPASFMLTSIRQEAGVGDRLVPTVERDYAAFVPHAPSGALKGHVVSIYGDALKAGQNQIIAINRGAKDGMERGHVLGLWRAGRDIVDRTSEDRALMRLPDERVGLGFLFRVFDRVSYVLILSSLEPVSIGDIVTQP